MDHKILIETLKGQTVSRIPFWFMRQAGRYLPEYRQLRSRYKNFLEYCYTPEAATEATLQPIKRFGMDAAIIFSDILVIPDAMGMEVRFEEGRGPVLVPLESAKAIETLAVLDETHLEPVYQALRLTRKDLPKETALIGFAGLPWTLACYMIEGGSSKAFGRVTTLMRKEPEVFSLLVEKLVAAVITHARNQIEAGAEIIQLFDSWAGLLSEDEFMRWSVEPTRRIVSGIKASWPDVPVIGFPRQAGSKFLPYAKQTGVQAVSIDASVPLEWAKNNLQPHTVIQGCLSNELLAGDKNAMLREAGHIVETFKDKPFVFNLGHGILPTTPVENMQALCDFLKQVAR